MGRSVLPTTGIRLAFLRGDLPLRVRSRRVERFPDGLGLRYRKSPAEFGAASRGTLPAKHRDASPLLRACGVGVSRGLPGRGRLVRTSPDRRGRRSPRATGLLGQGRTRRPRATCSARAVRAEARAQSSPGGGCAPARCDLPAPTCSLGLRPPGGRSGRRRGPRWAGWCKPGRQVP